jgi:membrane protein
VVRFINIITVVYYFTASLAIITRPFIEKEEISGLEVDSKRNEKWKNILNNISISVAIIIMILITFILKIKWIEMLLLFFLFLETTNGAYASLTVIRKTISSKATENLSKKEIDSIFTLGAALLLLNIYNIPKKLVILVSNIQNAILSDWLILIVVLSIITLEIFLTGVMGRITILAIVSLLRKTKKRIKVDKIAIWEMKYDVVRRKAKDFIKMDKLSIKSYDLILQRKGITRIWLIILFFTIPIDAMLICMCFLFIMLLDIIGYFYLIVLRINRTFTEFYTWLKACSERKVVNLIFRGSFIISITMIVIINRYTPLLQVYKQSTGGMEFLASAIIIPLIFSWIIEYNSSTKK